MRTAANRDPRSFASPAAQRTTSQRKIPSVEGHGDLLTITGGDRCGPRAPNAAADPAGGVPESSGGTGPTQADPLAWVRRAA